MINLAIIGWGIAGKIHFERIQSLVEVKCCGIIKPKKTFDDDITNLGIQYFDSIETCLKGYKLDGVIIASPNKYHVEQTIQCLEYGIPVLLEKPIAANINEAITLMELPQNLKEKVLVGHHRSHSPIIKAANSIISEGKIGKIVTIFLSAQFLKPKSYFDKGPWRKSQGGGPILINLIHEIDILRRLVGDIAAVQVISSSNIRNFEVEDSATINCLFENGVLGNIMLSDAVVSPWSWELTSKENLNYPPQKDEDCYFIAGTEGSLSLPSLKLKYYSNKNEPSWWQPLKTKHNTIES